VTSLTFSKVIHSSCAGRKLNGLKCAIKTLIVLGVDEDAYV